jgi:hypothetical protein
LKHIAKTVLMASAMAAAGLAQAQLSANVTIVAGGPAVKPFGWDVSLQGFSSLAFSENLVMGLPVIGITATVIAPATGTVSADALAFGAPILSVSGQFDASDLLANGGSGSFTATNVGIPGGVSMVTGAPNFATTGGSLSVTGLSVDLASQGIFATVSGGNGLATRKLRVWDFANIEGTPSHLAYTAPPHSFPKWAVVMDQRLTGLTITDEAFAAFSQGLGLKAAGIAVMLSAQDYGVMTITTIPEPSTYLLMGLGLVGVATLANKRKTAA